MMAMSTIRWKASVCVQETGIANGRTSAASLHRNLHGRSKAKLPRKSQAYTASLGLSLFSGSLKQTLYPAEVS